MWSASASESSGVTGPTSRRMRPRLSSSLVRAVGSSASCTPSVFPSRQTDARTDCGLPAGGCCAAPMPRPSRRARVVVMIAVLAWRPGLSNGQLVAAWRSRGLDAALVSPADARERASTAATPRSYASTSSRPSTPASRASRSAARSCTRACASSTARRRSSPRTTSCRRRIALGAAGIPHPCHGHVTDPLELPALEPPLVLKPRFGSWGRDVLLCRTRAELAAAATVLPERQWFRVDRASSPRSSCRS